VSTHRDKHQFCIAYPVRGDGQAIIGHGRNIGNVWLRLYILCPSCAVNTPLTMSEHHSSVPSGHACASEKPSPFRPGDGFCLSEPWSRAMSELDKVQPGVNLLSAFTLTIVCALALGLPMAVAIIWVCS
jgi:hypothetical protein